MDFDETAQLPSQFHGRSESILRAFLEESMDDPDELLWKIRTQLVQWDRFGLDVLHRKGQGCLAGKRRPAREHVIGSCPERVKIAARIDRKTLDLLWTHVQRSPQCDPYGGQILILAPSSCQPEICDFDLAIRGQEQVIWLDVSMHQTDRGGLLEGRGRLP